jgi:O-succinylbenzoate synthase
MTAAEDHRRKSDAFLREATTTQDLRERSRLIGLAVHWNEVAAEAERATSAARRAEATVVSFDRPAPTAL